MPLYTVEPLYSASVYSGTSLFYFCIQWNLSILLLYTVEPLYSTSVYSGTSLFYFCIQWNLSIPTHDSRHNILFYKYRSFSSTQTDWQRAAFGPFSSLEYALLLNQLTQIFLFLPDNAITMVCVWQIYCMSRLDHF